MAGVTGFLGGEIDGWIRNHHIKHSELFEKSEALNIAMHRVLCGTEVQLHHLKELVVSALFARCLEHYQGTLILILRGMVPPAVVVERALLESLFTIAAVAADDATLYEYVAEDKAQKLKMVRKALELKSAHGESLREQITPSMVAELTAAASSTSILSTKVLAERAGLHDLYVLLYSIMTFPAHSKARDLERYIRLDESGRPDSLWLVPSDGSTQEVLATAGVLLLQAHKAFARVFPGVAQDSTRAFEEYFESIFESLLSKGTRRDEQSA